MCGCADRDLVVIKSMVKKNQDKLSNVHTIANQWKSKLTNIQHEIIRKNNMIEFSQWNKRYDYVKVLGRHRIIILIFFIYSDLRQKYFEF